MKITPEILDKLPPAGAFYILDLSSWARAIYEGARHRGVNVDDPSSLLVVRGVLSRLWEVIAVHRHEPGYLAIAADVIGDEAGRRVIWPGYKAGRTPAGPGYGRQIAILLEVFAALRIPVFQASGFEADDYASALTRRARYCGLRVVLLSGDQDLWQLFDDDAATAVVSWDVVNAKIATSDTCRADYGVPPSLLADLMSLAGDGDEAPGIKGIGTKKAAALLERHGSLAAALAGWEKEKGKLAEWLRDGAASAHLSRELVTLRAGAPVHVPLGAVALGWSEDDTMRVWKLSRELGIAELREVRTNPKRRVPRDLDEAWIAAGAALEIEAGPGAWRTEPEPLDDDVEREAIMAEAGEVEDVTPALAEPTQEPADPAEDLREEPPAPADEAPREEPKDSPAPSWRALVAMPAACDGSLFTTPMGRWDLLVGRWVVLTPARAGATLVHAQVLESPRYSTDWRKDHPVRSRVRVLFGGREDETEIPNALVDRYLSAPPAGAEASDVAPAPSVEIVDAGAVPEAPPAPAPVALDGPPVNDLEPIPLEPEATPKRGGKKQPKAPKEKPEAKGPQFKAPAKAQPAAPRDERQLLLFAGM